MANFLLSHYGVLDGGARKSALKHCIHSGDYFDFPEILRALVAEAKGAWQHLAKMLSFYLLDGQCSADELRGLLGGADYVHKILVAVSEKISAVDVSAKLGAAASGPMTGSGGEVSAGPAGATAPLAGAGAPTVAIAGATAPPAATALAVEKETPGASAVPELVSASPTAPPSDVVPQLHLVFGASAGIDLQPAATPAPQASVPVVMVTHQPGINPFATYAAQFPQVPTNPVVQLPLPSSVAEFG